jgi:hypothetical protein
VYPVAEVVAVVRHEPGHLSHRAAHRRVPRRVVRPAGEVRHLEWVRVEWHAPTVGKFLCRTDVVEVTVGQHDALGPRSRYEAPRDRPAYVTGRPPQAGVDEQLRPAWLPKREDVDEDDAKPPHLGGYRLEHTVLLSVISCSSPTIVLPSQRLPIALGAAASHESPTTYFSQVIYFFP